MKEQHKIPTGKVERAMKLVGTGARIGGNYLKYYTKKSVGIDDTETLHKDNAEDIYNSLSKLKGSALKVTQMLSMDKNFLPRAYTEKFAMSQYSAPPMSAPLVEKTIRNSCKKSTAELFDYFESKSAAAASIGQVHRAKKDGKNLAVKVQYPGVADSIKSDLKLVKPIAKAMFGLPQVEMDKYFTEVEEKLLEETDYFLEIKNGTQIRELCSHIKNVFFPGYYPELSGDRVIVMDWLDGLHLKEFLATSPTQKVKNIAAQALWDFYEFQLHDLKELHADPHPGNFLFQPDGKIGIIDFGCIKKIPEDFYYNYFPLIIGQVQNDLEKVKILLEKIEVIFPEDESELKEEITTAFLKMTKLLSKPFTQKKFVFSAEYIDSIYELGEEMMQLDEIKRPTKSRGSRHALYINRAFFGLYTLLADLEAEIDTEPGAWLSPLVNRNPA